MKKACAILILAILLCSSLLAAGTLAFAEAVNMDNTAVLDDLKGSKIAGETFDPDNYGYAQDKSPAVLSFAEYGFAADTSDMGDYALYVYLYNPSGKAIRNTLLNKISIATVYENGKATDYDKFVLDLLSVSTDKYANLFYKFKVLNVERIYSRVSQNTSLRRYDIGEIEINYGGYTSEAYAVGNFYEYSGFAQGYGADAAAESSLTCTCDAIETLQLDVKNTYYRYNNGLNTQSNLNSVYFGVPSETLQKYGKLQQIKANWFETHADQIPVLTDFNLYDFLCPHIGISTQQQSFDLSGCTASSGKNYKFLAGGKFEPYITSSTVESKYYFHYDGQYHEDNSKFFNPNYCVDFYVNKLIWLFYSESSLVSTDEILSYAQNYTSRTQGDLLIDKYAKELFVEEVDEGRQYGWQGNDGNGIVIDADSKFDINGFTTGSKFGDWWNSLFYKDLQFDDLKNNSPIYIVNDTDLLGSDEAIAKRLLIDENDVDNFKTTYNQNKVEGKKTVLFRFALTDYTAFPLYGARGILNTMDEVGYMAQETVFLDFDIIWLKFVKENQETVIPVVSSPIDVFSGLTPPFSNSGLNLLAVILGIVVIVLIVLCVYKLFTVKKR